MTANFKIDSMTGPLTSGQVSPETLKKNDAESLLQAFLAGNPQAKTLTEAARCSITAQTTQGHNYIVITSGNTNTQIEATNGAAQRLFEALKGPSRTPASAASSHAAAPPTAASSHAAVAPAPAPAKNTTLLELENSILRKKQTLISQKGLLSMVGSYLPSFSKPTPDKLTIELYKELFTYYQLKGVELSNPLPTEKARSFEDEPLHEMLGKLYAIKIHLAPLEYFEVLNFIDDARHSQGLIINKAVIEAKIAKLATTIKSLEGSREHELNLELNKNLPQGTTQESLASMIRVQQKLLKTDDANSRNPYSFDGLSFKEREAEETKLQALLLKYYNHITTNLTASTSDTPMELQQRNYLLNLLKDLQTTYPSCILALPDYCAILNKIDQAMASGNLIEENHTLLDAIQADITELEVKLIRLASSAEGDLTLFMQGVVK